LGQTKLPVPAGAPFCKVQYISETAAKTIHSIIVEKYLHMFKKKPSFRSWCGFLEPNLVCRVFSLILIFLLVVVVFFLMEIFIISFRRYDFLYTVLTGNERKCKIIL
jgi:hypothetical protein